MKNAKKIACWFAFAVIAYFILFHTPWIICYTNTYAKWYRNFLWIEAGKPYDADSLISINNPNAIIREYIQLYQSQLFDKLFWAGKIKPDEVKNFQSLVARNGDDLIIVNVGPLIELSDNYERQRWLKGMDAVRRGDKSAPPQERAFFEFAMLHFQRLVFRNPFNKTLSTTDETVEIKHWP
jgi:hypothetical protein